MYRKQKRRYLSVEQLEERCLMAVIDLAAMLPSQGTTIFGADESDRSGFSVSGAGDVNGDGYDDFLIGAAFADAFGNTKSGAGDSYVIFGSPAVPATIDLATLGQVGKPSGVTIFGVETGDLSGFRLSGAGDVNGDGFDDLIIGAYRADALGNAKPSAGDIYVIFGATSLPPTIDMGTLGQSGMPSGVVFYGADASDQSGYSVSSVGDMNGDGFDDLVIGAPFADGLLNSKYNAGDSYVIFGGASLPASINLSLLGQPGQPAGITIFGATSNDRSGTSVSGAGDVNGDGFDDLIIGAFLADVLGNSRLDSGKSYVVFGAAELPSNIDLTSLGQPNQPAGITILGADAGDESGISVSGKSDVNGDGFDDLIIGASFADSFLNSRSTSGDGYVVFGGTSLPSTIDLRTLGQSGQTPGITIFGSDADDRSGTSISNAGDVNGDGFDDLIIGAFFADALLNTKYNSGDSYVLFGDASLPSTIDLSILGQPGQPAGITIQGADSLDYSGVSVNFAGDVNGDGFGDLVIGAFRADAFANDKRSAGDSYLILGSNFTNAVTQQGTPNSEILLGSLSANVINGGRGNDTLIGGGGADVLMGGQGNDILTVSDPFFKRIVGGTGNDTLRLDGSGIALDLTSIRDNRILGIETIDLIGNGSNSLTLSYREVLNISDESNTLIVRRDSSDVLNINGGWIKQNQEDIGGILFQAYSQGRAILKIQALNFGATVINRQIFYNRSSSTVFGNGAGNPRTSIDATKSALLPGQTTSFANYSNYIKGLNGLVIDVVDFTGTPTVADFQFATWEGNSSAGFTTTNAIPTLSVLNGRGIAGSTRLKIEFPDNAIRNTWLRVTMLSNGTTGLFENEVFYFGNAVADVNVGDVVSPATVRASEIDTAFVRQHLSNAANSVAVTNIYDLNKDGRVSVLDVSLSIQNRSSASIRHFTAPASFRLAINPTSLRQKAMSVPSFSITSLVPSRLANSSIFYATAVKPDILIRQESAANNGTSTTQYFAQDLITEVKVSSDDSKKMLATSWIANVDNFFSAFGKNP